MSGKKNKTKVVKEVVVEAPASVSGKTLRNRKRRQRRQAQVVGMRDDMTSTSLMGIGKNATRSAVSPNPADPRTGHTLWQLGNTIPGRQAALKMLHPCMEECNAVVKVPDGAVSTSVSMERRDDYSISFPAPAGSNSDATVNWNCLIVHAPLLNARTIAVRWYSGDSVTEAHIQVMCRQAFGSAGSADFVYPNWYTQNDTATGNHQMSATILQSTTLSPSIVQGTVALPSALFKSVRRACYGVTIDFDAPDLSNQGRVIEGQWTPDIALGTTNYTNADDQVSTHDVYKFMLPAVTSDSIVSSDEFCRQALARDGSYMPLRLCAPTVDLTAVQEYRETYVQEAGSTLNGYVPGNSRDLYLRGWSVGVSYFDGMSYQTNLRVKIREDLELVASPESTYSPFSTPALPKDERAITMVQEFARTQPHAYPSDYNDLGEMLPHLIGGIGNAVGSLGIPVISSIGKGVAAVARSPIGGLLGSLLGKLF